MAKKLTKEARPEKKMVSLRRITPGGSIVEMEPEEAKRLLDYEAYSGLKAHELHESDSRPDQGTEEES